MGYFGERHQLLAIGLILTLVNVRAIELLQYTYNETNSRLNVNYSYKSFPKCILFLYSSISMRFDFFVIFNFKQQACFAFCVITLYNPEKTTI